MDYIGFYKKNLYFERQTYVFEGTTYIVKVISSASATLFGVSASFTIRASPTIVMISPTVDTKWARGASLPIRWNAEGVGSIRIELLDQNDAVVQTIATPWITAPGNNKFDFEHKKLF